MDGSSYVRRFIARRSWRGKLGRGLLASCRWLRFVIRRHPRSHFSGYDWKAKGCHCCIKHICDLHAHPLDRVSSPRLCLAYCLFWNMIGRVEDQRASRCCCRCQLPLMVIPWKWTLLRGSVENRGRYQLFLLPSMLPARRHPIKAPSRRFARHWRCKKLTRQVVMSRNAWQSKFSAAFLLLVSSRNNLRSFYLTSLLTFHNLLFQINTILKLLADMPWIFNVIYLYFVYDHVYRFDLMHFV